MSGIGIVGVGVIGDHHNFLELADLERARLAVPAEVFNPWQEEMLKEETTTPHVTPMAFERYDSSDPVDCTDFYIPSRKEIQQRAQPFYAAVVGRRSRRSR